MRALLLAAGPGLRLRPLTDHIPKCLVKVRGRPLLDYWLDLLLTGGEVARVLVNTHHLAEQVERHIENSKWHHRVDLAYEPILLGTGGTLYANRHWLGDGDSLVAHADNLTDLNVRAFRNAHRSRPSPCIMTMLAFRTDNPTQCGILWRDEKGILTEFAEKPKHPTSNLANGAVYMFDRPVARCGVDEYTADISMDLLPRMIGRAFVVDHHGYHRDIGTPQSLALANHELMAISGRQMRPAAKSANATDTSSSR